jgi:hypothetical protein
MSVVSDLVRLYGSEARYLSVPARPLPDGVGIVYGSTSPEDRRDLDRVAEAGRLSRILYRMAIDNPAAASRYEAMLRAYFSRAGVTNQQTRLTLAIEELEHREVRLRTRRRNRNSGSMALYRALLQEAIAAFSRARQALEAAAGGPS